MIRDLIYDVCVGSPCSTSDHGTVSGIIHFEVVATSANAQNNIDHSHNLNDYNENGTIIPSEFNWEAAEWPNLNIFLTNCDWENYINNSAYSNDYWTDFYSIICIATDKYASRKSTNHTIKNEVGCGTHN